MKIAVTGDTVGNLPDIIGEFDIFVHCGNFSPIFEFESTEVQIEKQTDWMAEQFNPWLKTIRANHKIVIAGHLDLAAQWINKDLQYHIDAITLQDESVQVSHKAIYGMNWILFSEELAAVEPSITDKAVYTIRQRDRFAAACSLIPDEVEILVTRMPPYGILDEVGNKNMGSKILLEKIKGLKHLKLHIFGLISDNGGQSLTSNGVVFANAAVNGFMEITV